ncbi:MAG: GDSL-type esterase/lipase family protein [Bacteroidales bacterium]
MRKTILLIVALLTISTASAKIKVACVGNSVTYGYLLKDREVNAYPSKLQHFLGSDYEVGNFGHSGATLLKKGHRPYMNLPEFKQALAFNPDLVVIHLGLNDTDPRNWANYREEFINDYSDLIDSFRVVNPKAKFYICRMSPIFNWHPRFQSGTRDWYWQIQRAIEQVAKNNMAYLIDLQEVLYDKPHLMPDALHPNEEGAELIAKRVYSALSGDYGGVQLPKIYSDNMVLQRRSKIAIKGTANAGEKVTVQISKQKRVTNATADGKWEVELEPMEAGGPYSLSIETKDKKLIYKNILIGEVWLCSGQSNMRWRVNQSAEKEELTSHAKKSPSIRIFDMQPRWETSSVEWDSNVLTELNNLQYFNTLGWVAADSTTVQTTSAIAYAFAKTVCDSLNIPIGIIHNSVGGSPAEAWIDRKSLEFNIPALLTNWKKNDHIQQWVRERAALNVKAATNPLQRHPYEPAYLFESAIKPLKEFPIQGVIWYQGESNAHNTELHERLFPMLIDSWRENWGRELPFYYVQLSSLNRPSWPLFRDSQRSLMHSRENLGMVVSSDRGDSLDVHPRRKREIGERLAHLALCDTYKMDITPSGPLFRNAIFARDHAIIEFDYAQGLTTSDSSSPSCFEIADDSGIFHPAEAKIENDKLRVWNRLVKNPKYVRYAWQPFTRANLVNKSGLPASTFQTSPLQ